MNLTDFEPSLHYATEGLDCQKTSHTVPPPAIFCRYCFLQSSCCLQPPTTSMTLLNIHFIKGLYILLTVRQCWSRPAPYVVVWCDVNKMS